MHRGKLGFFEVRRTWVRVSPLTKTLSCMLFRLCETFSQIFLMSPKGPPFQFFSILQKNGCSKNFKGPHFHICDIQDTSKKVLKISKNIRNFVRVFPHAGTVEENTRHFEIPLLFLSIRYGVDYSLLWKMLIIGVAFLRPRIDNFYKLHKLLRFTCIQRSWRLFQSCKK